MTVPLTKEEYEGLERLLQWPEDLPAYDKLNTPTPITTQELFGAGND